jgi:rod shape-determining protein MreC
MQKFTSTKLFKIIVIAIVFAGLIFLNPSKFFSPIRAGFGFFLLPFQKVVYSFSIGLENARELIESIGKIKSENEKLIKENQQLLSENVMLHDMKNENAILREQIGLLPRDQYNLTAASVVSQDPNGISNWLEIDKGSNDGITDGMPVIVSKGILIGKVQNVSSNKSQVMLLTNPKSTVNVITTNSGAKGVAKGEYGTKIILDMVLQTDSINVGDSVVTSGISGEIPRGLYVGVIQEIHQSGDYLFQQAILATPLQNAKTQIVFVIKNIK